MQLEKSEIEELIKEKVKTAEAMYGRNVKLLLLEALTLQSSINKSSEEKKSRLIPLAKWNEYHPYPTVGALRQYKFYKDTNGFDEVLEYGGGNGGRILINEDEFFKWLRQRKNKEKNML